MADPLLMHPRPWFAHGDSGIVIDGLSNAIARVYAWHPGGVAELLAAAPDLLAACEAALEAFVFDDETCADGDCSGCYAATQLRAAIVKARGEVK